jgi:F-type H+-transporting ATPase subunit epsilon
MKVKLVLPNKIILDAAADKITAPGTGGAFQILPRHVDVVWTLEAGILIVTQEGVETFYAIDQGVLVKQGDTVFISCFQAIKGHQLEDLNKAVAENYRQLDDKEEKARKALVKLETDTLRRFLEKD